MIVEAEPVEVGGSANAFVALREVEQGEAIGRPGQAEPHLEGLPDGGFRRRCRDSIRVVPEDCEGTGRGVM